MPKREHHYKTVIVALLLTAGWVGVADAGKRSPETDLAAPGAALYEQAVKESVITLKSKKEQAALDAQGRPPSPGPDYYWCENCKTYHKRPTPASPGQPTAAQRAAAPASPQQPDAAVAARPPSPGPDYFWCKNCKTYHKRQTPASPGQPAGAQRPVATPASPQQLLDASAARPASPGADYYWCEKCKTYHKRQAVQKQPGAATPAAPHAHAAPPAGGAAQAQGADYYYCDKCKTYHRRQPVALQPSVDVSRIFGGVTNSPNRNPLIDPAGAER
jgi:hypothetical protein